MDGHVSHVACQGGLRAMAREGQAYAPLRPGGCADLQSEYLLARGPLGRKLAAGGGEPAVDLGEVTRLGGDRPGLSRAGEDLDAPNECLYVAISIL